MKYQLLFILIVLIFSGCEEEQEVKPGKITGLKFYNQNNEVSTEYEYGYDSEGRLSYKATPNTIETIQYVNQFIAIWNKKYDSGEKTESYYYSQYRLDSISSSYVYPRSGIDLIHFSYEDDKCVSKTEIMEGEVLNVYNFNYEGDYISEIILIQNQQNDTLHYVYEYDQGGNIHQIFLNGFIYSDFEYTSIENPLFKVSKPYLAKIPIHPNQSENESITSRYLLSKANYYDLQGELVHEISMQYSLNDFGLPVSAVRTFNGLTQNIEYEYQ